MKTPEDVPRNDAIFAALIASRLVYIGFCNDNKSMTTTQRSLRRFSAAFAAIYLTASMAQAGSGSWTGTTSGSWGDTTKWSAGNVASGVDAVATIQNITASITATNNFPGGLTLGGINRDTSTSASQTFTISSGTLSFVTTSGQPAITTAATRPITISSVVSGTQGLVYNGPNSSTNFQLSGNNTSLSGQITVNSGRLVVGNSNALGATGAGNGTLISGPTATSGGVIAGPTTGADSISCPEDIEILNGNFGISGGAQPGTPTFSGQVTISSTNNANTVFEAASSASNGFNMTGKITGTGLSGLIFKVAAGGINGTCVLRLSGSNDYANGTTIAGLTNTTGTGGVAVLIGNNNALSTGTLTITNSVPNISIGSTDSTARTLSNAMVWSPSGTNTPNAYTLGMGTMLTGTILGGSGDLTFNGSLAMTGTISSRTIKVANTTTLGGVVSGSSNYIVTKNGAGTLVLSNASNTFDGKFVVAEGKLSVTGNHAGAMDISAAGTLIGTGTVSGPLSVAGTVAPGTGAASTLTIGNSVTFNSGGAFAVKLDNDGNTSDKLAINGTLDLTNTDSLAISLLNTTPTTNSFVIATYTSLVGGTFNTVTGLPDGYSLEYGANAITLVIPEPATFLMIFAGMGVLVLRRRSRKF